MTTLRLLRSLGTQTTTAFKAACAIALVSMSSSVANATQGTYVAENGLLVVPFERANFNGDWNFSTSTPGFALDGYIRWDGPNLFNSPGTAGVFHVDFEVNEPGTWVLAIRNRHENPDPTEENDVWVRVDNGPWIKVFSNGPGSVGGWTWESRFDQGSQPQASYNLGTGVHEIEFSGRSFGFKMDRFHLHRPGAAGSNDQNRPESPRRFGAEYCNANTNSSGSVSTVSAFGSPLVSENDVTLSCAGLPNNQFGIYLVSSQTGFTPNLSGTQGNLCLGGSIRRFSTVLSTGSTNRVQQTLNLNALPSMTGTAPAQAGETLHFQFWHRDVGANANMSRGLTVNFE